jgi:hypothetical protein
VCKRCGEAKASDVEMILPTQPFWRLRERWESRKLYTGQEFVSEKLAERDQESIQ